MEPLKSADLTDYLIAGDSFSSLFIVLGRSAVPVGMPVAITIRRSNGDRLASIGEIGGRRLGDVADRSNLHDGRLRLLQHQFFVNRADLGLLFVSLFAASALLFGRGQRNVMLQVANTRCVVSINLQRVLVALQVDVLAFA